MVSERAPMTVETLRRLMSARSVRAHLEQRRNERRADKSRMGIAIGMVLANRKGCRLGLAGPGLSKPVAEALGRAVPGRAAATRVLIGVEDPAVDTANEVPSGLQGLGRRRTMPFGPSRRADRRFVAIGARSEDTPMGYPEPSITTTKPTIEIVSFQVEGMTCASCVNRITRFLGKVEGVEEANINLASDMATVRFDPGRTDLPTLAAAVEAAGYTARIDRIEVEAPVDEPSYADRHLADLRRRLIVAAVLTIPLLMGLARMTILPGLPAHLHRAVVPAGPRHARPVLCRRSVLPRCAQRPAPPDGRHEHARGGRDQRGVLLQRRGDRVSLVLRGGRLRDRRCAHAALLRHRGGDHHADPARSVSGGARAQPHLRRHPQADRPRATDGARGSRLGRGRHPDRGGRPGRCRPCPGQREDPGRRRRSATGARRSTRA